MDLFGEPLPEDRPAPTKAPEPEFETLAPSQDFIPLAAAIREEAPLLGLAKQEDALAAAYASSRMPHGLIFAGPKGIGKAALAFRLTRFLLTRPKQAPPSQISTLDYPQDHQAIRLIASGAHPDLLLIEREYDDTKEKFKDSVSVDSIRKVTPFLRKTASMGGWRIVIIDDADTMNRSAQNALLKILEEPPVNTVLILIAHRMGTLIPTIRSRCRMIGFQAPSGEIFEKLLQNLDHYFTPEEIERLYERAQGSVGEALRFIESGGPEILQTLEDLLAQGPQWPWPLIHKFSDQLSGPMNDELYKQFAETLPWMFRRMAMAKARGQTQAPNLQAFSRQSSLETLLKICENLEDLFATVQKSNLDKRQAVLSAFSLIAA